MAPPRWLALEYARRAREAEASGAGQTIEEAFGQKRVAQTARAMTGLKRMALPIMLGVGLLLFMGRR